MPAQAACGSRARETDPCALSATGRRCPPTIRQSLVDIETAGAGARQGRDLAGRDRRAVSVQPGRTPRSGSGAAPRRRRLEGARLRRRRGGRRRRGRRRALFRPGDAVVLRRQRSTRPGTNAEFHLVDERIVGTKPRLARLGAGGGAAADGDHRLGDAVRPAGRSGGRSPGAAPGVLIVGGAGGVGSMAIQLARRADRPHGASRPRRGPRAAPGRWSSGRTTCVDHARPLAGRDRRRSGSAPRGCRVLDHRTPSTHLGRDRAADRAAGALRLIDDLDGRRPRPRSRPRASSMPARIDVHRAPVVRRPPTSPAQHALLDRGRAAGRRRHASATTLAERRMLPISAATCAGRTP